MEFSNLILLAAAAFGAGFIDACAGGGGLIQLPALLIVFGNSLPIPTILGTNKLSSFAGTSVAAYQYVRCVHLQWKSVASMAAAAFTGSLVGAAAALCINQTVFKPIIIFLLIAVALYTGLNKRMGLDHNPRLHGFKAVAAGVFFGFLIGGYDGFFGPGTGSFLLVVFIALYGYSFIAANAATKVVNACTNCAALIYFASSGSISYQAGLIMALFNIGGNFIGARIAIVKGSAFVRKMYFVIVAGLIVKLVVDLFRAHL